MKLFRRSPKPGLSQDNNQPAEPAVMEQPADAAGYIRRGYALYQSSKYDEAVEDFTKAFDLDQTAVDAVYGMGMSLKAAGKKDEAVAAFKRAIAMIDSGVVADKPRARILRRLALGHVNLLTDGDWNLEAEIWQHVK